MNYLSIFPPLKYQFSLSSWSNNIVSPSFTLSKGNRLESRASAIMAVREKTRAQLFNLSLHSHAEQARAYRWWEEGEGKSFRELAWKGLFLQGPKRKQMQTNKQDTEEFLFIYFIFSISCVEDATNLANRTLWHPISTAVQTFSLKSNPRFPSLPHFSSPCPSFWSGVEAQNTVC